jgi:uncharacterized protein affecting Mg2+/Co2+ transport
MADTKFYIKKDDTRPYLRVTVTDQDDAPVVLTSSDVIFNMVTDDNNRTSKVNSEAVIVSAVNGIAEYRWATGDTETAGNYLGEFQVTLSDGTIFTVPPDDSLKIIIKADYGDTPVEE